MHESLRIGELLVNGLPIVDAYLENSIQTKSIALRDKSISRKSKRFRYEQYVRGLALLKPIPDLISPNFTERDASNKEMLGSRW